MEPLGPNEELGQSPEGRQGAVPFGGNRLRYEQGSGGARVASSTWIWLPGRAGEA